MSASNNNHYAAIIPTHNRPALVRRAVTSVLDQSSPPRQIIVVDDGSDVPIQRSDLPDCSSVMLVTLPEALGACAARNVGLSMCATPFVAFLDDDDVWHADKMRRQLDALSEDPSLIAVTTFWISESHARRYKDGFSSALSRKYLRYENFLGSLSSLCVRFDQRTRSIRFDNTLRSCQDWDYYLELSKVGLIGTVEDTLVTVCGHDGPRITSNLDSRQAGLEQFIAKHRRTLTSAEYRWLAAQLASYRASAAERIYPKVVSLLPIARAACMSRLPPAITALKTARRLLELALDYRQIEDLKSACRSLFPRVGSKASAGTLQRS
jgi:glycosyltransferase involved in cell wall biosynthesis